MPKTYDQAFIELNQAINHAIHEQQKELEILNDKPFYSRNHIDALMKRLQEQKTQRPYLILFGVAIGALITIVIIHYT